MLTQLAFTVPMTPDAERVWQCIHDCMCPDGIPMPIKGVISAKTKKNVTVADVEIFDGSIGTIEVSTWGHFNAWSIRWLKLETAFGWNGKRWRRYRNAADN